jgi:hypothetical protein
MALSKATSLSGSSPSIQKQARVCVRGISRPHPVRNVPLTCALRRHTGATAYLLAARQQFRVSRCHEAHCCGSPPTVNRIHRDVSGPIAGPIAGPVASGNGTRCERVGVKRPRCVRCSRERAALHPLSCASHAILLVRFHWQGMLQLLL